MGSQTSKAEIHSKMLTDAVTTVMMENKNVCAQTNKNTSEQVIGPINVKGGCSLSISNIKQKVNINPEFSCSSASSNDSELMNKIVNEMESKAKTKAEGMTIGSNTAESLVTQDITNKIRNELNIKNLSECIQTNVTNQLQKISNIDVDCSGRNCDRPMCTGLFNTKLFGKNIMFFSSRSLQYFSWITLCHSGSHWNALPSPAFRSPLPSSHG